MFFSASLIMIITLLCSPQDCCLGQWSSPLQRLFSTPRSADYIDDLSYHDDLPYQGDHSYHEDHVNGHDNIYLPLLLDGQAQHGRLVGRGQVQLLHQLRKLHVHLLVSC